MNITQIYAKKNEIEQRVMTPGYKATERDVAEAAELVNSYMDELERIESIITPSKITDIEPITNSIIKRWYPNE